MPSAHDSFGSLFGRGARLGLVLILLAWLWLGLEPRSAHAANVNCSATATTLNLGTGVNVLPGSAVDSTATINWTCTNTTNQVRYVRACFSIGDGVQGSSNFNPRVMRDGSNNPLTFQIYIDPGRSIPWGSVYSPLGIAPGFADLTLGKNATGSGSMTMHGRILANQATAVPGAYQDQLNGNHTDLEVNEATGGAPTSCGGSNGTNFPFTASATLTKQCNVNAGDMDFGTAPGLLTGNIDNQTSLQIQCTNGTAYQVGLDDGLHASGGSRYMIGPGAALIRYALYRDSARSLPWGTTLGSNTVAGNGSGNVQPSTAYGRVPVQVTPTAGLYTDTVTVTVTF